MQFKDYLDSLGLNYSTFRSYHKPDNSLPIKCQCCPHIETIQLIWIANQLTGFSMRATLALNGLISFVHKRRTYSSKKCYKGNTKNQLKCLYLTSQPALKHFLNMRLFKNTTKIIFFRKDKYYSKSQMHKYINKKNCKIRSTKNEVFH